MIETDQYLLSQDPSHWDDVSMHRKLAVPTQHTQMRVIASGSNLTDTSTIEFSQILQFTLVVCLYFLYVALSSGLTCLKLSLSFDYVVGVSCTEPANTFLFPRGQNIVVLPPFRLFNKSYFCL